jgi:hypothetical protein
MELNTLGRTKVSRTRLVARGFDFGHYTSTYTTKEGALYFFCYDQGYLPIEKENLLLVVKNEF